MKIYFCDICNESIPLQDLKDHIATTIKGKLYCKGCNPLATVTATPTVGKGGSFVQWALTLLSVTAVGVVGYEVYQMKMDGRLPKLREDLDAQVHQGRTVAMNVDGLEARIHGELDKRVSMDRYEESRDRLDRVAQKLESLSQEITRLQEIVVGTQEVRSQVKSMELKQEELDRHLQAMTQTMEQSVEGLSMRLDDLLADAASGGVSPSGRPPRETPGAGGSGGTLSPALQLLLKELDSKDAGKRWAAVDELAESGEAAVVPYLIPLLNDSDPFVQIRVVDAMGSLSARGTVKHLIPLLRDSDPIVREGVLSTLVQLTGQTALHFDVRGKGDERERGVRTWEAWYEENSGRFEG